MDSRLLIDSIVRQTTVLIAELATAMGVRAPLAHVADQVFLQLAREIEAQGVGRKVVADMFGLALRSYQRKVQRLTDVETARPRTLWEAVLEFVSAGPATRLRLKERFRYDGEDELGAVLSDLVDNGLLTSSGKGDSAVFSVTTPEERRLVERSQRLEALTHLVWQRVFARGPSGATELAAELGIAREEIEPALQWLSREGRLQEMEPGMWVARNFDLPLGSAKGWEAAVFDHYSAMVQAIASKAKLPRSESGDTVGGSTFTFTVYPEHPNYLTVLSLLSRTRAEVAALWQKVSQHNQSQAVPALGASQIRFYFGQDVRALELHDAGGHEPAEQSE